MTKKKRRSLNRLSDFSKIQRLQWLILDLNFANAPCDDRIDEIKLQTIIEKKDRLLINILNAKKTLLLS